MIRREALLGIGSGIAVSALASAARAEEHTHDEEKTKPSPVIRAAREAAGCAVECEKCYSHCMHMVHDGKDEHASSAATCLDCADICSTASRIFARKGAMTSIIRDACIKSCTACAEECDKHPDHPMMKECAAVCKRCIEACKAV